MILLKKVRLINWYGFSNVTAPIGFFYADRGKEWKRKIRYAGRDQICRLRRYGIQ